MRDCLFMQLASSFAFLKLHVTKLVMLRFSVKPQQSHNHWVTVWLGFTVNRFRFCYSCSYSKQCFRKKTNTQYSTEMLEMRSLYPLCSFNIQILLFLSFAFDVESLCCTDHQGSQGSSTSEYLETYTHILFVTGNRRMNFLVNCHAYST